LGLEKEQKVKILGDNAAKVLKLEAR
jgi:predicted TIM-barrel fold metal-dependent hydrolase